MEKLNKKINSSASRKNKNKKNIEILCFEKSQHKINFL
jgi:hypothetical protein